MNFFRSRARSFAHAIRGLFLLFRTQKNARIHLVATAIVVSMGIYFSISYLEWLFLTIAITSVLIAEALNTAIEFLGDAVTRKQNSLIGKAKDVAAGAVLISAIGAGITGLIIFLPRVLGS